MNQAFVARGMRCAPSAYRRYTWACLLVVLLGVVFFCVRGYRDERAVLHFRDFKEPYGGARCLLLHCDPYDSAQVHDAWHDAGGVDVEPIPVVPYTSLYPPFSLAALAPFAALPLPVAHDLWKALIAVVFSAAVFATAALMLDFGAAGALGSGVGPAARRLVPLFVLLAVFAASSTIFLMLGQMSAVAIPLLVIGLYCVQRGRAPALAVFCLVWASMLKPQETGFLVLYLALATAYTRRIFTWTALACAVCIVASVLWISSFPAGAAWFDALRTNLHGAFMPGNVNSMARGIIGSMELIQLGGLFGAFDDQALFSKLGAAAVSLVLFLAWLAAALKLRDSVAKHVLAIAALACFTLLPVYHRQYDSRLLILVFPAVAYLLTVPERRTPGYVMLALAGAGVVLTSHTFLHFLKAHFLHDIQTAGGLETALFFRPMPLITLTLCLGFIGEMYRLLLREREQARSPALDTPQPDSLAGRA